MSIFCFRCKNNVAYELFYLIKRFRSDGSSLNSVFQHFPRQPFPDRSPYQPFESIHSVPLTATFVLTKRKFVQITGKMLQTERVISAVKASFQHCKDGLNAVGRSHPVHELLCWNYVDIRHQVHCKRHVRRRKLRYGG